MGNDRVFLAGKQPTPWVHTPPVIPSTNKFAAQIRQFQARVSLSHPSGATTRGYGIGTPAGKAESAPRPRLLRNAATSVMSAPLADLSIFSRQRIGHSGGEVRIVTQCCYQFTQCIQRTRRRVDQGAAQRPLSQAG